MKNAIKKWPKVFLQNYKVPYKQLHLFYMLHLKSLFKKKIWVEKHYKNYFFVFKSVSMCGPMLRNIVMLTLPFFSSFLFLATTPMMQTQQTLFLVLEKALSF